MIAGYEVGDGDVAIPIIGSEIPAVNATIDKGKGYLAYTITTIPITELSTWDITQVEVYIGELNDDGVITGTDRSIISANLNKTVEELNAERVEAGFEEVPAIVLGDLNGDGIVTGSDVSVINNGNINKSKDDATVTWSDYLAK